MNLEFIVHYKFVSERHIGYYRRCLFVRFFGRSWPRVIVIWIFHDSLVIWEYVVWFSISKKGEKREKCGFFCCAYKLNLKRWKFHAQKQSDCACVANEYAKPSDTILRAFFPIFSTSLPGPSPFFVIFRVKLLFGWLIIFSPQITCISFILTFCVSEDNFRRRILPLFPFTDKNAHTVNFTNLCTQRTP